MVCNLPLDGRLVEETRRVGGKRTKRDALTLDLFSAVDFDPSYDSKRQRRR